MEPVEKITVPSNIEGVAIHLGYINKNLEDLNVKMTAMQSTTVSRAEWNVHLLQNEDHEARIRATEKAVQGLQTMIKVWGSALGLGLAILEIALRFL